VKLESGGRPFPEVAELAARIASLEGIPTVLDFGCAWTAEMTIRHPELKVTGIGQWGAKERSRPSAFPFTSLLDISSEQGLRALSQVDATRCVAVLTDPSESPNDWDRASSAIDEVIAAAPLTILATTTPESVLPHLEAAGLTPTFLGRTRASEQDEERTATLIVVDRSLRDVGPAPSEFRVVAIMTTYNEEDVIGPSIGKLVADGIGVYLIDNWSTDRTHAIAAEFMGRGLVGLERFPDAPTDRYEWRSLLGRVEDVAESNEADWLIHHDADERRCGPWAGLGLRDALWKVDQSGFSAVDHTVLNFQPIDNGFVPGGDFEACLRHFEFGRGAGMLLQIKAWKNLGRVDLASDGGHEAVFPGRRVFPYKFELKHYPIRSQLHGELKVFRDRVARWDPNERAIGWHRHYDDVRPQQSFLRDAGDLIEDCGAETRARFLAEMVSGAGLAQHTLPAWALRGPAGRGAYLAVRRLGRSRAYGRLHRALGRVRRRLTT
jgi:hypothetical protein